MLLLLQLLSARNSCLVALLERIVLVMIQLVELLFHCILLGLQLQSWQLTESCLCCHMKLPEFSSMMQVDDNMMLLIYS